MKTFSRLHAVSIIVEFLKVLKRLIIPGLLIYFTGKNSELEFLELKYQYILVIFTLLVALFFGFYRWLTFKYFIENNKIHIKKGMFIKQDMYISKEKIKSIDVTRKIIPRLFGLVQLNIKVEGIEDNNPIISFIVLSKKNAEKIQSTLVAKNAPNEKKRLEIFSGNQDNRKLIKITKKEILLFSLTSNILLPSIFTITALVIQFNDQFSFANYRTILELEFFEKFLWICFIVLSAFLLATVKSVIQFSNFELEIFKDEIRISKGYLEKKETIILVEDIRAIKVEENILRQILGYSTIYIESSSNGSEKNNVSMVLMPLIQKRLIINFLDLVLPFSGKSLETKKLPPKAKTAYLIRSFLMSLPVILILGAITENFILIVLIVVFSFIWGWIKFREVKYGFRDDYFKIRTRFIRRNTLIIRRQHIETLYFSQTFIQKNKKLMTLKIMILSNTSKKTYRILDYAESDQHKIYLWYKGSVINKK